MSSDQDELILTRFEEALTQTALSSSTIVNYLTDLRTFLRWGKNMVSAEFSLLLVNQEHIRLYRCYLAQTLSRAASTTNRHLMALRKFYTFTLELGVVSQDPTVGVALVQDNGQITSRILSNEEISQLLKAATNGSRAGLIRRDVAILQLLLYTGLKVNEVVALKKGDLIFNDPGVELQICTGHNRSKTRYLPLPNTVCKALTDYLHVRSQSAGTDQFFLSQEGRSISKRTVQRMISNCAKNANLDGVSAQSIRRTFAVQLLAETQDIVLVSKRLGHQSKSITEQYLSVHDIS